jgi:localization factor PodJL
VLRQIEGALIAMRGIATRVASSEALAKLSDEVRGLAGKIDQAASRIGASVLSALEGRLAELSDALEARKRDGRNGSPEFEVLTGALIDKIERRQVAHGHSSLARLEELIGKLAESSTLAIRGSTVSKRSSKGSQDSTPI